MIIRTCLQICISIIHTTFAEIKDMANKNVGGYFDGRTNKKIMQAPGGSTSISLAWPIEQPNLVKNNIKQQQQHYMDAYSRVGGYQYQGGNYSYPDYSPKSNYQLSNPDTHLGGYYGYRNSNDMATNPYPQYTPTNNTSNNNKKQDNYYINEQINAINYGVRNINNNYPNNVYKNNDNGYGYGSGNYNAYKHDGNGYGYGSGSYNVQKSGGYYRMPDYSPNSYAGNQKGAMNFNPTELLDIAVTQHDRANKSKSISHNPTGQYQYKPSIKVLGPPPPQFVIGNPNYNFWTDTQQTRKQYNSEKRISSGQTQPYERNVEKTSVKVSNPPGGRQSLKLG